jgi:hypothetical protein
MHAIARQGWLFTGKGVVMRFPNLPASAIVNVTVLFTAAHVSVGYCATSASVPGSELKKCQEAGDNEASLKCYQLLTRRALETTENTDTTTSSSQNSARPVSVEGWDTQFTRGKILDNMEFSYITASSGVRLNADQATTNMLYEAQIFKNISWYDWQWGDSKLWLDIPVKITLRQLSENSKPVRTPSYSPGLRLYYSQNDGSNKSKPIFYYSLGVHHYSNGQEGNSATREGLANTRSGSFNTNYAETAGHIHKNEGWLESGRLAFRQHLYGTWEPFQFGQYPKRHVSLELRSRDFGKNHPTQFRLTETVSWGNQYVAKNDILPALNVEARTRDRFHTTLEMLTRLSEKGSLAFYVRYDLGYDYYNIHFQNRMSRFQIGVAAR